MEHNTIYREYRHKKLARKFAPDFAFMLAVAGFVALCIVWGWVR